MRKMNWVASWIAVLPLALFWLVHVLQALHAETLVSATLLLVVVSAIMAMGALSTEAFKDVSTKSSLWVTFYIVIVSMLNILFAGLPGFLVSLPGLLCITGTALIGAFFSAILASGVSGRYEPVGLIFARFCTANVASIGSLYLWLNPEAVPGLPLWLSVSPVAVALVFINWLFPTGEEPLHEARWNPSE